MKSTLIIAGTPPSIKWRQRKTKRNAFTAYWFKIMWFKPYQRIKKPAPVLNTNWHFGYRKIFLVITPCHNDGWALDDLARSLQAQKLQPARWLVVDDSSTDDSPEVVGWLQCTAPTVKQSSSDGLIVFYYMYLSCLLRIDCFWQLHEKKAEQQRLEILITRDLHYSDHPSRYVTPWPRLEPVPGGCTGH